MSSLDPATVLCAVTGNQAFGNWMTTKGGSDGDRPGALLLVILAASLNVHGIASSFEDE